MYCCQCLVLAQIMSKLNFNRMLWSVSMLRLFIMSSYCELNVNLFISCHSSDHFFTQSISDVDMKLKS